MVVVPDASVILKWVLQKDTEADHDAAFRLLDDYRTEAVDICLPTLWRYEVGNILGHRHPDSADAAMRALLAYEFREEPLHQEYCLAVLRFMKDLRRVSFYDVAYHVLAIRLGGTYVTADVAYARQVRSKRHLRLLSEWKSSGGV
jgi:predicted nucleic acid-binding protein